MIDISKFSYVIFGRIADSIFVKKLNFKRPLFEIDFIMTFASLETFLFL